MFIDPVVGTLLYTFLVSPSLRLAHQREHVLVSQACIIQILILAIQSLLYRCQREIK